MPAPATPVKRILALLAGAALLVGMLAYVGPRRVVHAIEQASPVWLVLSLVSYALFFVLRGWRWRVMLSKSAPDVRVSSASAISAVGWLANSFLPLKGGDVLRAALMSKREGVPGGTSAASVGLERVLDMVGAAMLAAAGLFLIPDDIASLPRWLSRALEVAWLLPLVCIIVLAVLVLMKDRAIKASERTIGSRMGRFGRGLHRFVESTVLSVDVLARHPRLLLKLVPLTFLVALTQTLVFACLVRAFLPATPFLAAFGGSTVFLLTFALAITPGNVGTYEAAFAAVFAALGNTWDEAVAAGVLTHLTTTATVAVLGSLGLWMLGNGRTRRVPTVPAVATTATTLTGGGRA
jgi:uncharacterized protein (TIRG00374 family)